MRRLSCVSILICSCFCCDDNCAKTTIITMVISKTLRVITKATATVGIMNVTSNYRNENVNIDYHVKSNKTKDPLKFL